MTEKLRLSVHTDIITSFDSDINGNYFISGSLDKTAKLWSIEGKCLKSLTSNSAITSVSMNSQGDKVAISSFDTFVHI